MIIVGQYISHRCYSRLQLQLGIRGKEDGPVTLSIEGIIITGEFNLVISYVFYY